MIEYEKHLKAILETYRDNEPDGYVEIVHKCLFNVIELRKEVDNKILKEIDNLPLEIRIELSEMIRQEMIRLVGKLINETNDPHVREIASEFYEKITIKKPEAGA